MFSADYVREIGTQFPLGIDTNHVGDSSLPDRRRQFQPIPCSIPMRRSCRRSMPRWLPTRCRGAGCPTLYPAPFTSSSSQAAVNCYLTTVPDREHHGFRAPWSGFVECVLRTVSVLGLRQAASGVRRSQSSGGIEPYVLSQRTSLYTGIAAGLPHDHRRRTRCGGCSGSRRRFITRFSKYKSNIAEPNGSGGDYSLLNVAENYNRPHRGYWGDSGMDRTHQLIFNPTAGFAARAAAFHDNTSGFAAPADRLCSTAERGRSGREKSSAATITGDGTVGDLLPATFIGSTGKYSTADVTKAIAYYNANFAGRLTPAGATLVNSGLFSAANN